MKVAVTGANGYLGSVIVDFLLNKNIECVTLVRNPNDNHSIQFNLGDPVTAASLADVDCLIHAAHDFSLKKWADIDKINIQGSSLLFKGAKDANVKKIIYISSMSSFQNCQSNYGKSKYLIEQELIQNYNGYIIRPGLIYGEKKGGMVYSLSKVAKLPVLPLIGGNVNLHLCHYTDLLNLLNSILLNEQTLNLNKPILAANETPYTFKQILNLLGANILIPFPWQIIWGLLKTLESCGINLRTGSDNLISLMNQDPNPNFSTTKTTMISFSEFHY